MERPSDDGRLLLLNVNTGLNVHVFEPTGNMGNNERAGVTCLEESPALDTIAVGLANGRVIIHNVRRVIVSHWSPYDRVRVVNAVS